MQSKVEDPYVKFTQPYLSEKTVKKSIFHPSLLLENTVVANVHPSIECSAFVAPTDIENFSENFGIKFYNFI